MMSNPLANYREFDFYRNKNTSTTMIGHRGAIVKKLSIIKL